MATIFHLALASEWAAAQESGAYTTSTLGRSLAEEGFIHASRADQWTGVRDRFYGDVTEPLVLLHIDTDLLDVPVVEEPPAPGVAETFPHIYGRLPVGAVVKAMPVPGAGRSVPTQAAAPAAVPAAPGESFSRVYLREMYFNLVMVGIALVACTVGMAIGLQVNDDTAPLAGGLAGLVVGTTAAVVLYRRRHAASA